MPADVVAEGDNWLAIKDIHPQAPVHILIIPKKHLTDICDAQDKDTKLLGEMMMASNKIAKELGLEKNGFRLIINHGKHGGQLVPHLHIHLLGGKRLDPKVVTD